MDDYGRMFSCVSKLVGEVFGSRVRIDRGLEV